jgi:hypothetical protein
MKTKVTLALLILFTVFAVSCKNTAEKIKGEWTLESTEVTGGTNADPGMVDMMKQIYSGMNGQIWSFTQAEYKLGWANAGGVWYYDKNTKDIVMNSEFGEQKMKVEKIDSEKMVLSSETSDGIKITHYLHKNK